MCLGVPAEIITIHGSEDVPALRSGEVRFGHLTKTVNLACVPHARVGDHVLIHAGIAIGVLLPEEAAQIEAALDSLEEPF